MMIFSYKKWMIDIFTNLFCLKSDDVFTGLSHNLEKASINSWEVFPYFLCLVDF